MHTSGRKQSILVSFCDCSSDNSRSEGAPSVGFSCDERGPCVCFQVTPLRLAVQTETSGGRAILAEKDSDLFPASWRMALMVAECAVRLGKAFPCHIPPRIDLRMSFVTASAQGEERSSYHDANHTD